MLIEADTDVIYLKFDPQHDITAYELACLLPSLLRMSGTGEDNCASFSWWEGLPLPLKRHLKRTS